MVNICEQSGRVPFYCGGLTRGLWPALVSSPDHTLYATSLGACVEGVVWGQDYCSEHSVQNGVLAVFRLAT